MTENATLTALPVWTPEVRMILGGFTAEQWAVVDSETANRRTADAAELRARAEDAERRNSPLAALLRRLLINAVASAERAQTFCTNSGKLRTECTACDHSRQFELMAARAS